MMELNERFFWIINTDLGRFADAVMIAVTCTAYTLPAVAGGAVALRLYGKLTRRSFLLLVAALLVGGGTVHALKQSLPLDRPLGYFSTTSPALNHKVHAPFSRPHHRTFPSGHSQTAFGVAVIIALIARRHTAAWLLWAAAVALSRVYLGVHFPLDVIAGSLIGGLSAFLVFEAGRQFGRGERKTTNELPKAL